MDEKLHSYVLSLTEKVVRLVKDCATEPVLGTVAIHIVSTRRESEKKHPLVSPARQVQFFIGLLLTTPEPDQPKDFTKADWTNCVEHLNDLFYTYALMFWPSKDEYPNISDEWRESRQVAMPAFLHYFNTGILASVEQVVERVQNYITPFDADIDAHFGLTATEAISVAQWISGYMQDHIDKFRAVLQNEKKQRIHLLDRAKKEGWDIPKIRDEAQKTDYPAISHSIQQGFKGMFKISIDILNTEFGERISTAYWTHFVATRGEIKNLTYLTEKNLATLKPLYATSEHEALCPLVNALYWAVLQVSEEYLSSYIGRDSFFIHRDKQLERDGKNVFLRIFNDKVDFYSSVFETVDSKYEHDLVIIYKNSVIVVEAKASPPIEPFRDPDKAFLRLQRAFRSDRGIQKAFDQASRIIDKLNTGSDVNLYTRKGVLLTTIRHKNVLNKIIICLTRDDFGPLAVDLSLLLQKNQTQKYPWAVNILDLDTIINAFQYFEWSPDKLINFIQDRERLHGKVIAFDELDIVGFSIKHGELSQLLASSPDKIFFNPEYSEIFDRIEIAQAGGEQVIYAPTRPFIGDIRKIMKEFEQEIVEHSNRQTFKPRKIGRNEQCLCGSGLKYKKCCGK